MVRSEEAVRDLKRYLERNYHRPLRIGTVCVERYHSEQYVCRRFRELLGVSPKQYLMQLRLRHTAQKLLSSNDAIYQIAFSCGFTDINNFCKQFRGEFGCTPGQYREQNKKDGQ